MYWAWTVFAMVSFIMVSSIRHWVQSILVRATLIPCWTWMVPFLAIGLLTSFLFGFDGF